LKTVPQAIMRFDLRVCFTIKNCKQALYGS
jgi:hypothetical protein